MHVPLVLQNVKMIAGLATLYPHGQPVLVLGQQHLPMCFNSQLKPLAEWQLGNGCDSMKTGVGWELQTLLTLLSAVSYPDWLVVRPGQWHSLAR